MICLSSYYPYMMLQDCLQPGGCSTCIPFASLRINMLSTSTSIGMLAYKAGLVEALRLRYQERKQLRVECTSLLAELQRAANQSSASAGSAPAPRWRLDFAQRCRGRCLVRSCEFAAVGESTGSLPASGARPRVYP